MFDRNIDRFQIPRSQNSDKTFKILKESKLINSGDSSEILEASCASLKPKFCKSVTIFQKGDSVLVNIDANVNITTFFEFTWNITQLVC